METRRRYFKNILAQEQDGNKYHEEDSLQPQKIEEDGEVKPLKITSKV